MDFHQHDKRTHQRRQPPNYLSRSVQVRLLALFGALALVIVLMEQARRPKNWAWMWNGRGNPGAADVDGGPIDTRLPPPRTPTDSQPGTIVVGQREHHPAAFERGPITGEQDVALQRARRDAWSHSLDKLEYPQRQLLDKLLKASRGGPSLAPEENEAWARALEQVDRGWSAYLEGASQEVLLADERLPPEEKELWLGVLRQLELEWTGELKPALTATLDGRAWTERDRDLLAGLQGILDGLALEAVRDDTIWRPAERHAWFRLLEILAGTDNHKLRQSSLGVVGFLQLFKQAEQYRGKLVTVRGTARLAYRVQAPQNIHAIEGYYIFWLKPFGGANRPIVVYALETPPGFPEIKDKEIDAMTTTLDEDVEFTGFFFKRWAYRAKDGLNTAPMLLAKAPVWHGRPTERAESPFPTIQLAVACVVAVGCLSIALAVLAYKTTSSGPPHRRFQRRTGRKPEATGQKGTTGG